MSDKKLGLITVLYNAPDILDDFFRSISVQNYKNYHLYVIDNSSNPEPLQIAMSFSALYKLPVTFIDNKGNNNGVTGGNNQGIEQALADRCDYLAFINNDLIFDNESLFSTIINKMASSRLSLATPVILSYPEKKIWYAGGYIDKVRAVAPHYMLGDELSADGVPELLCTYAPTCFLFLTRELILSVGNMDEKYFAYYDDTDFMFRCGEKGYKVSLLSDLVIYHKVGSSTGGDLSAFGAYHLARNRIYFIRKNMKGLMKAVSLCYTLMTRCIRLLSMERSLRTQVIRGLIDGFRL